jgi:hypothetical protein
VSSLTVAPRVDHRALPRVVYFLDARRACGDWERNFCDLGVGRAMFIAVKPRTSDDGRWA